MLNPYQGGAFRVTSIYGNRDIGYGVEFHKGLDLVGESSKKLLAIADGVVYQSRMVPKITGDLTWQWGNYVTIKADTGELITYAHLSERLVEKGQKVKKGDVIGIEGSTGWSSGSHCHLEIRTGGNVTTSTVNTPEFTGIPNKVGKYVIEEEIELTKAEVQELIKTEVDKAIEASKERVYHWWKELPEWAEKPIKALYKAGYFAGNSPSDLNLPEGTMRTLVVLARALKADGKISF